MGAWDVGPFDNDDAADWSGMLDDADPAQRPAMVEDAFRAVLNQDGYLQFDPAAHAIAAAAILAAHRPGGRPVDSPYSPDFLTEGGRLDLDAQLDAVAVAAL